MKRYYIKDTITGRSNSYSRFVWNLAWFMVFICGVFLGILISKVIFI